MFRGLRINECRGYCLIPRALLLDFGLSEGSRILYVYLHALSGSCDDVDGGLTLSFLSSILGYSCADLRDWLFMLAESGWVDINGVIGMDDEPLDICVNVENLSNSGNCDKEGSSVSGKKVFQLEKYENGGNYINNNIIEVEQNIEHTIKTDVINSIDKLEREIEEKKELKENISKRKEEEKEENEKERELLSSFSRWWELYDKKVGRAACLRCWRRLTKAQRSECIAKTPAYVASTPEKQYRKHPLTYLHGHCWDDEIIESARPRRGDNGARLPLGMVLEGDREEKIKESMKTLWK